MTILSLASLLADSDSWSTHSAGWGMGGMMIGMVLFWGAIILGIVWLIRAGVERRPQRREETALSLLDRRLAEGTLSPDDYHQRRNILTRAAAPHPERGAGSPTIESRQR